MTKKILIIGAGITGVCTAEHLRRAGFSVTLIDHVQPGDPSQTSFGNAGLLARAAIIPASNPSVFKDLPFMLLKRNSPVNLRWSHLPKLLPWALPFLRNGTTARVRKIVPALDMLAHDTVDQHIQLAKGTKAAGFITAGTLTYLYPRKKDYLADPLSITLKKELGVVSENLTLSDMREIDPKLGDAYEFGARYKDNGHISDPGGYLRALFDHFMDAGGKFEQGRVAKIDGQTITLTDGRDLNGDTIVIATGAWSGPLAEQTGHKAPVIGERGYHVLLKTPSFKPAVPYLVTDYRCGLTPMDMGVRCAGTTEFAPLDAAPASHPIEYLRKAANAVFPTLEWAEEETWLGHRPSTPDSLPMVGRSHKNPNVIFAFGAQHLGLTIGPKVGRLVTQIVTGETPNVDMSPLAIDRFD
jgi:D-amino-acid dehydrogenase